MRATLTIVVGLCFACSGEPNEPSVSEPTAGSSGTAAGSAGAGNAGGTDGGAAGSNASGSSGESSGGAGAGGTAGSAGSAGSAGAGGGAELVAADLLPLAVGNTWTYSATDLYSGCEMLNVLEVVSTEMHEGRMAYRVTESCTPDSDSWLSEVDGAIESFGAEWQVSMGMPVAAGTTWPYGTAIEFGWEEAGTVTVQAGTFENCWSRINVTTPTDMKRTYCPGVGRVLDARDDQRSELVSYQLAQ